MVWTPRQDTDGSQQPQRTRRVLEQMLQSRTLDPDEPQRPPPPEDRTFGAAVDRITAWAKERNYQALVLSKEAWSELVCNHLENRAYMAFYKEIMDLAGTYSSEDEANELISLASNVWNNTPQPKRGGRTANEIASLRPRH